MYSKDGTANVFNQNVGEDARFFASFLLSGNQDAQLNQNKLSSMSLFIGTETSNDPKSAFPIGHE
jgi:hypothetical protein